MNLYLANFYFVGQLVLALLVPFLLLAMPLQAQQDDLPFDVFGNAIDNGRIYRHLENEAVKLVNRQTPGTVKRLQSELGLVGDTSDVSRDELTYQRPGNDKELYQHMVKSTVYLGELYNCGKCDKTHAGFSGGVVISEDGLVLTNYHVLEQRDKAKGNRVEGYMAMTYDGKCWEIDEILAADKAADIALVKLRATGKTFYAAPIAVDRPNPTDVVRVISHPSGEFFVMTRGEVSRYARRRAGRRSSAKGHWMEITADFGGGSSGSAVFNNDGEVVGLVSRIRPLMRGPKSTGEESTNSNIKTKSGFVEMVLRKCVPLSAIHNCFK